MKPTPTTAAMTGRPLSETTTTPTKRLRMARMKWVERKDYLTHEIRRMTLSLASADERIEHYERLLLARDKVVIR